MRTVLISAASKPALAQVVIRAATHEGGMFPEVWRVLEATYATLLEISSMDAGWCSEANARLVAQAHKGYLLGLKGNQPELRREAERLLGAQLQPELSSPWELSQGHQIRYHLSRTTEMEAYLDWSQLKQVWRVEQEIRTGKISQIERENRYSLTNLHRGRLKAEQIVSVVRSPWAIENNGHWTVDVVWEEDTKTWGGQGMGIHVLGLLRLMAYTLVSLLRCRYWRKRDQTRAERRRWAECFDGLLLLSSHVARALFPDPQVTAGV